ncbi:MAG: NADH-quinone oxidoreductase subunit A [Deltaproteobacteria bacterium]|nr:NADH-quinone oxidoreductase subunit A [Deltaproteobacteria bacterium]
MAFGLATAFGFVLVSGGMLLALLVIGRFVRIRRPVESKLSTYECGEKPFGSAWFNFNNRFYVIALVFVIFDVEVALVVPVAVVFRRLVESGVAWLAFAEMFFFLAVLLVALAYVWARGDLSWIRALTAGECREVEVGAPEGAP